MIYAHIYDLDAQNRKPSGYCPKCGAELYGEEPEENDSLCPRCAQEEAHKTAKGLAADLVVKYLCDTMKTVSALTDRNHAGDTFVVKFSPAIMPGDGDVIRIPEWLFHQLFKKEDCFKVNGGSQGPLILTDVGDIQFQAPVIDGWEA